MEYIIIDPIDHIRSLSIGLVINFGASLESKGKEGLAHFLEHLIFRIKDKEGNYISRIVEENGGIFNGYTTYEYILIYARIPYYSFYKVIEAFKFMIDKFDITIDELETEKGVVIEEIRSSLDDPEEVIFERYNRLRYEGTGFSHSILGNEDTIKNITLESILKDRNLIFKKYPRFISISGYFKENFLSYLSPLVNEIEYQYNKVDVKKLRSFKKIDNSDKFNQSHFVLGFDFNYNDIMKDHYSVLFFNAIMLDTLSSRLFKKLRDDKGLVYVIYPSIEFYKEFGSYSIYFSTSKEKYKEVLDIIEREIYDIIKKGFSKSEINFAKNYLKGQIIMSDESPSRRMINIFKHQLFYNKILSIDERINFIENFDIDYLNYFIQTTFKDFSLYGLIGEAKNG